MPRQNRITPFGDLIATPARGMFIGNRGVLHNAKGELTGKQWSHRAWITCALEYKGARRELMQPGCYTELFFLDEVTALAAGHRPCALCRPKEFKVFKAAWLKGNAQFGLTGNPGIGKIDEILHQERVSPNRLKVTFEATAGDLPNGVFLMLPDLPETCFLYWDEALLPWSPHGYGEKQPLNPDTCLTVLTPQSIVNTLRAGYTPRVSLTGIQ